LHVEQGGFHILFSGYGISGDRRLGGHRSANSYVKAA
jgi:hypothetical protein